MPPLYVYRLDETTGKISMTKVENYIHESKGYNSSQLQYVFMMKHGRTPYQYRVTDNNMDKYVSGKLVSFDDDQEKAAETIKAYYRERVVVAKREVRKFEKLITQIDSEKKNAQEK